MGNNPEGRGMQGPGRMCNVKVEGVKGTREGVRGERGLDVRGGFEG